MCTETPQIIHNYATLPFIFNVSDEDNLTIEDHFLFFTYGYLPPFHQMNQKIQESKIHK